MLCSTGKPGYDGHKQKCFRQLDMLSNNRQRIPKGQSKMNNLEKLATQGTHDERKTKLNNSC